ncbi:hypothetical protein [Roseomonas chloroacetimidivorans]|uniref:hypothetical protein n=1 Tax=Roseomonas chloroacetimidivorans TaxID=1766656 RepID=UPI003C712196
MNPVVLAWALTQPVGTPAQAHARAYSMAATRVTVNGNTIEYRSPAEIASVLTALYGAIGGPDGGMAGPLPRGPSVTRARFSRGG